MKTRPGIAAGLLAGALLLPAAAAWAGGPVALRAIAQPGAHAPVVLAQAGDAAFRVNELEEQVRQLNGRVEELTFQLLQLQEQLRRMQEDNEFRFQELEQKRGALPRPSDTVASGPTAPAEPAPGKSQPSEQTTGAQRSDGEMVARAAEQPATPRRTIDGVEIYEGPPQPPEGGLEPRTLGTLVFDAQGNVVGAEPGEPQQLGAAGGGQPPQSGDVTAAELPPPAATLPGVELPPAPQTGGEAAGEQGGQVAALPPPAAETPEETYSLGYNYVQAGDYANAEATFREFSELYPDDPRIGEARFWLGDSILSQARYEEAAKVFLDAHKKYPDNRMASQNLLKLGVALAGMNQRELACATFAEVPRKYPDLSNAVRAKVAAEQKAISCKTN